MLKIPRIRLNYHLHNYYYTVPLEIVYLKPVQGYYSITVWTVHKEGKGIAFCTQNEPKFRLLLKSLEEEDINTRLKVIKRIIKKLIKKIQEEDIILKGIYKIKHNPFVKLNKNSKYGFKSIWDS